MTTYNVHIHREVLLTYGDVEADSPEDAASTARGFATGGADRIDDCEDLSARVELDDPARHQPLVTLDFPAGRQRKAAAKLLDSLKNVLDSYCYWLPRYGDKEAINSLMVKKAQAAIAEAETSGIRSEPSASALLAALKAVLPYAESERASLEQCWGRDDDARVKEELDRCDRALDQALAAILETLPPGHKA
jgi:hypothetical protein